MHLKKFFFFFPHFSNLTLVLSGIAWYTTWFQVRENMAEADSKFYNFRKTAKFKSVWNYFWFEVSCKVGDQKAPFSIATTPRCRGECYSFPWIAPLYPWYVPYIAEC